MRQNMDPANKWALIRSHYAKDGHEVRGLFFYLYNYKKNFLLLSNFLIIIIIYFFSLFTFEN